MTDKKPNEYVKGQFRRLMEAIESDVSKQDKIVDEACIAIDSAYEQGKLDLVELLELKLKTYDMGSDEAGINRRIGFFDALDWLKSQIAKEGEKR